MYYWPIMNVQPESELEMARRHVREAEVRLARQEAIIARLESVHLVKDAARGGELLEIMRSSLEFMKRHLREIETRSRG
jgi:hypothetical protein